MDQVAEQLKDEHTAMVVSSDFCHFGPRFGYAPFSRVSRLPLDQVEALDRRGMKAIESNDPKIFAEYLDETGNTICGRHPILFAMRVLAKMSEQSGSSGQWKWLAYDQSGKLDPSVASSSVSYTSGAYIFED